MADKEVKKETNYLRWVISCFFIIYLFIDLIIFKNTLILFHYFVLISLFIIGIADRFQFIKIPGFIELKNKTESIDKKVAEIANKIQQIQNVNVFLPPTQTSTQSLPLGNIQPAPPEQVQPQAQASESSNQ